VERKLRNYLSNHQEINLSNAEIAIWLAEDNPFK